MRLVLYAKQITESAQQGNKHARDVITYYDMLSKCPGDPASRAFCEASFEEWLKECKPTRCMS